MKALKKLAVIALTLLSVSVFSGCDLYTYSTSGGQTSYENPQWAPPYYNGARYYYLPDIESYYDLSSREFIFLNNGQWVYSYNLPSIYPDFDLNDCYTVVLSVNVYQPWMHHQYYVSHYPRYYYRDYYDHSNYAYVRGFNENSRSAIYWNENERSRARSWDNENERNNRQFQYTKEDRDQQSKWNNQPNKYSSDNNYNRRNNQDNRNNGTVRSTSDNNYNKNTQNNQNTQNTQDNRNNRTVRPTSDNNYNKNTQNNQNNNTNVPRNTGNDNVTRQPQNDNNRGTNSGVSNPVTPQRPSTTTPATGRKANTNYYGRTIGQPVKVEKQMRQPSTDNSNNSRRENDPNNQGRK